MNTITIEKKTATIKVEGETFDTKATIFSERGETKILDVRGEISGIRHKENGVMEIDIIRFSKISARLIISDQLVSVTQDGHTKVYGLDGKETSLERSDADEFTDALAGVVGLIGDILSKRK